MSEKPLVTKLGVGSESAAREYMRMFVGRPSIWALLRYEVVAGLIALMPGALGYFLRQQCFRWVIGGVGEGVLFGRGIVLRSPGQVTLADHVIVDDDVVLDAKGASSTIRIGNEVLIGRGCILSCNEARISVGDMVSIGPHCVFLSKGDLVIGSNVAIGSGVHVIAGTHETTDPDVPIIQQTRIAKGIRIEDGAWVGSGARILDGVTVGSNSIVGSLAMVSKDVPPDCVVLGNPARVVQKRK